MQTKVRAAGVKAHISVGGIYPTFAYDVILDRCSSIDSVVLGEGEETFLNLAEKIVNGESWEETTGIAYRKEGTVKKNDYRPLIKDLDSIPFPTQDPKVLKQLKYASMITSRGCYGRCTFCGVVPFFSTFGPKYRIRSSKNVLAEIEYLYNNFGVRNYMYHDAIFLGSRREPQKLLKEY